MNIFKLIKELPFMFVIAAIIWLIAALIIFKNFRRKKLALIITTLLLALVFTAVDIWAFIFYIPTHFKKNSIAQQTATISTNDLTKDIQTADTNKTTSLPIKHIDSSKTKKTDTVKVETKIYTTNHASVKFYSHGDDEDIEATNSQSAIALNSLSGDLKVVSLIKGFEFENQLMQGHFNEPEYMNSEAFPKSEFKGKITTLHEINFTKNGTYNATVAGSLNIHGVTQKISTPATIIVADKKINVQSIFKIKRIDYAITTNEIADELQITVKGTLQ